MSKVFKTIINILLVLTILILASYFVLRITNRIKIYNVETGSMEDKIHTGDYILLCRKNNYNVGDVVTYQVKSYFVTHRIVSIDGDKIITKGDANNKEDDEINMNQIVGKAIYWGGILNFIINYKYVLVAILIALYLISCYFDKDETKDEQQEDELEEEIKDEEIIQEIEEPKEEIDVLETDVFENKDNKGIEIIGEEVKEETIEKNEEKETQKHKKRSRKKENIETKEETKQEEIAVLEAETKEDIENKEVEAIGEEVKKEKETQKPKTKRAKKKENIEIKEEIKETKTTKKKTKKDK